MKNVYKSLLIALIILIVENRLTEKSVGTRDKQTQRILIDDEDAVDSVQDRTDDDDTSYDTQQNPNHQNNDHPFIAPNINPHEPDNNHHDQSQNQTQQHRHLQPNQAQFWYTVLLSIVLTLTGAFCSGMTVGFLSISKLQLEMMALKRNQQQSKMAKSILYVLSDHHLFLTTLLVYNAIALESLPIVVHYLMPDWAAILFSTLVVLVAAQIIPQAYCTGENKIIIAYYASPIVLFMMRALYFIILPIARGLDYLLGVHHENQRINRKDLKIFLNDDKILKQSEKLLLTSTLQLRSMRVTEAMIDIKKIYMFQENQPLNEAKLKEIKQKNYSYIMVYKEKRTNIVGFIKIKQFAFQCLMSKKNEFRASEVMKNISKLITVYADTNLLEMLMLFQAKSIRIAFICNIKKKIDPRIQSIMYSKSEMVLQDTVSKQAELIGVIFLHKIFDTMADIKQNIQRRSQMHALHEGQSYQMNSLGQPLITI